MSPRVAVIGGGISGLTAAHTLRTHAPSLTVQLLERTSRVGGLIRTDAVDGFLIERGPESILRAKPAALELAQSLGLSDQIIQTKTDAHGAFVVHDGRLHRIPEGFSLLAPGRLTPFLRSSLFSPRGKARALLEPWIPAATDDADESFGAFVRRRLGTEVLERIAQPMVSGIYGADADALSLAASMPRFREMERKHGSVIRGLRRELQDSRAAAGARYNLFFSFRSGMQALVDALAETLAETIHRSAEVEGIERADGKWRLAGQPHAFDAVIVALPAPRAAKLVTNVCAPAADALRQIPYGEGAAVTFTYDTSQITHPLDAYGFVVPEVEQLGVLACTFVHRKWAGRAPEGKALLRAFLGGRDFRGASVSDAQLAQRAENALQRLLGIRGVPKQTWVDRYQPATPHYVVGHLDRVGRVRDHVSSVPGLFLAGSAYEGVGIPDSVRVATAAAQDAIAWLHATPSVATP